MILKAAEEYNIDLSVSYMVGDKMSDMGAGRNAGCKAVILVRTGWGGKYKDEKTVKPNHVEDNLLKAAERIITLE